MTIMKKLLASAVASALMVGGAQAEITNNTVKIGYLADMSGTYRDLAGPNGPGNGRCRLRWYGQGR